MIPPQSGDPYAYEGKMIHVGTPGIFHKPGDSFYTVTKCGRDGADCRATDHRLEDYQPCVVCWPPRTATHPLAEGDHASPRTHVSRPGDSGLGAPSASGRPQDLVGEGAVSDSSMGERGSAIKRAGVTAPTPPAESPAYFGVGRKRDCGAGGSLAGCLHTQPRWFALFRKPPTKSLQTGGYRRLPESNRCNDPEAVYGLASGVAAQ